MISHSYQQMCLSMEVNIQETIQSHQEMVIIHLCISPPPVLQLISVSILLTHYLDSQHLKKTILETHGKAYINDYNLIVDSSDKCQSIYEDWTEIHIQVDCELESLQFDSKEYLTTITIGDNLLNTLQLITLTSSIMNNSFIRSSFTAVIYNWHEFSHFCFFTDYGR